MQTIDLQQQNSFNHLYFFLFACSFSNQSNKKFLHMASLRNRKSFSSPSLQELGPPPPIPTGKGSRSATDHPAFSEYVDNTKQVPELILPETIRRFEPAEIDYQLLLQGDDDSVKRILASASNLGMFQIIGHGISSEELKSTLIENQWVFEQFSQTNRHYDDHEELVWCHEIAEKAETISSDKNLYIFRQNMNKVACKLKEIAEELAPIVAKGAIKQMKKDIQTHESTMVLHRYHQTTAITDQFPSIQINESAGKISSRHALRLWLEPGEFSSQDGSVSFSFFTRENTIIAIVGDDFEEQNAGEFKNAIQKLKFKSDIEECGPLFFIELQYSSSDINVFDLSHTSAKKFTLADQILILLLLAFLYKTCCFLFS